MRGSSFEQATTEQRAERARQAAELVRLRRHRREVTRRRAAEALRGLAERIEPRRPDAGTPPVRSARPQLARPRT